MALAGNLTIVILSALVCFIAYKIYCLDRPPPLPKLDENAYWGIGTPPPKEDTSIKPFKINVSNEVLQDLKTRLDTTRPFTPPLEGIAQEYGFNTHLLQKIINYWKNNYKWREREVSLNQFPQFTTTIQGLKIHFIHVKPEVPSNIRVLPLLILHGWPASAWEFYEVIPILTELQERSDFVFEIIAPSLPGYAFSEGASKPGLGDVHTAVLFKNFMKRLGYEKFYVHGGDWGAATAIQMATLFPKNVLGLHSNMCMVNGFKSYLKVLLESICPSLFVDSKFKHPMYPLSEYFTWLLEESGYYHIQASKPDTIGVGLSQSPAGLAAYMLEKITAGTNKLYKFRQDSGLLDKFTYDKLLDNIMLYWITNSFTTSMRFYAESFNVQRFVSGVDSIPISKEVPCACARFPHEIFYFTDWILRDKYTNLIQTTDFTRGGHFIALEEPELLGHDILSALTKMEKIREKM